MITGVVGKDLNLEQPGRRAAGRLAILATVRNELGSPTV